MTSRELLRILGRCEGYLTFIMALRPFNWWAEKSSAANAAFSGPPRDQFGELPSAPQEAKKNSRA
jgi:hypothetical protein